MVRFGGTEGDIGALRLKTKPPVVILVEPQLGENIGMVARAMGNFGWKRLRLIKPRDGWPNAKAGAAASGAKQIVEEAELFDSLEAALADLSRVYATSARMHDLAKPVVGPEEAAGGCVERQGLGTRPAVGYVFGREAWGLTNDEVALCDDLLTLPVDPDCASLNIAQAVLICAYEWRRAAARAELGGEEADWLPVQTADRGAFANKQDLSGLFDHLEGLLDERGFFHPPEKRARMVRNLRTIFQKSQLTEQEVRTLRGVLSSLDRAHERSRSS